MSTSNDVMHPNAHTLYRIYENLARIGEFTSENVVLHTADGGLVQGRENVVAHERNLIRLTGKTLLMEVDRIVANDSFGAVLANLTASTVEMSICGLWKFRNGTIVEHWENAYDAELLGRSIAQ